MASISTVRQMTDTEFNSLAAVRANLVGAVGGSSKAYYAPALYAMKPLAAEGLGTWAVDKAWRLYVDPNNLPGGSKGWSVTDCAEVLEHEINHLLRTHADRFETLGASRDHDRWNIAGDLEINDDLPADGFVQGYGVTPAGEGLPEGKTAEWYYKHLPQQPGKPDDGGDDPGDEGDGEGQGQGDGDSGPGNGGKGRMGSQCGSGAGSPIDGELAADDPSAPGVSAGEATVRRRAVAEQVRDHQSRHGRGTVPGHLSEWADVILTPPTIPWQQVLGAAVRHGATMTAGQTDYTYQRISRRASVSHGVVLPAMYSPKPRVAAVVDTSASMSTKDVHEALSEVQGISAQVGCQGPDLSLLLVDAAVASVEPVYDLSRVKVTGRGGTDMRVGIEAALELRERPNVLVILTDGGTPWPSEQPQGVHVVIALVGKWGRQHEQITREAMPWAEVVLVGDDT